jgi:hypothetical protein
MNDVAKRDIAALAGGIIGTVAAFEQQASAQHYTDTGEAWDILRALKRDAQKILRKVKQ